LDDDDLNRIISLIKYQSASDKYRTDEEQDYNRYPVTVDIL
jgi:hypothetical protein